MNRDIATKVLVNRCDLCDDALPETEDNLASHIHILDEIDNSFESDLDKSTYEHGPKLILCSYCRKEYLLPSYY